MQSWNALLMLAVVGCADASAPFGDEEVQGDDSPAAQEQIASATDGAQDGTDSPEVPVAPTRKEPKIPPIRGACPVFRTGRATIMGLDVQIWAGPKKAEKTGSLIFYWHGTGSSSSEASRTLPASVINDVMAKGGIIVSPQNSTRKGQDSTNILGVFYDGDFEFTDLVTACAVEQHNVDPRRIYTTGCSAGGLQAGYMAYQRSSYLAAAVANSGGMVVANPKFQDTSHIPAVMTMHGGPGDQVIVVFSQTSQVLNQGIIGAGGFALNCNHGGGHCQAPPALQEAGWQFMQDHPFGVDPEPYKAGAPASFPRYCTPATAAPATAPPAARPTRPTARPRR